MGLDPIIVTVKSQTIVGRQSSSSPDIEEFLGIPYGTVSQRWENATLREDDLSPQELDATRHGQVRPPKCPQLREFNNTDIMGSPLDYPADITESEFDCLNLFITRPAATALQQAGCNGVTALPVLVWIHGGGYAWGAGSDPVWDPTRLILRSVELGKPFLAVCINYRLGLFGFGASSSLLDAQSETPFRGCNVGLCDQRVALEWVARNIGAFGGDPDRVTIAGQSAGGISVQAHVLDAKARGTKSLFQRGIVQSGAVGTLGPISLQEVDERWRSLCRHLGIVENSPSEQVAFLRDVPASDLVRVALELGWPTMALVIDGKTMTGSVGGPFEFVLGPESGSTSQVASLEPIDVLIGDCDAEGRLWVESDPQFQSVDEIQSIIKQVYTSQSTAEAISQAYHFTPNTDIHALHLAYVDLMTDIKFGLPVHAARQSLSSSNNNAPDSRSSTVQSYRIQYTNPFPGPLQAFSHHCVDMIYIFDAFHQHLARVNEPSNRDLVLAMQTHWIHFIWDGCQRETSRCGVEEDEVRVYGRDRRPVVKKMREDAEWREREKRFELLKRDPEGPGRLWDLMVGLIPRG